MKRIALTDGSGKWFNEETSEKFDEATEWNGSNHISKATGSQWNHECLYRTKSGKWILNSWSQWQGSTESYTEIDNEDAAVWLSTNEHDPHESCEQEFQALEL